jgi:hypothetical protein
MADWRCGMKKIVIISNQINIDNALIALLNGLFPE